jgi:hypothetical protein
MKRHRRVTPPRGVAPASGPAYRVPINRIDVPTHRDHPWERGVRDVEPLKDPRHVPLGDDGLFESVVTIPRRLSGRPIDVKVDMYVGRRATARG